MFLFQLTKVLKFLILSNFILLFIKKVTSVPLKRDDLNISY